MLAETEIPGGGGGGGLCLTLQCHHQNDSCVKMGNDVSHLNVSVNKQEESHNQAMSTTIPFEE